jgi:hypothetical protein
MNIYTFSRSPIITLSFHWRKEKGTPRFTKLKLRLSRLIFSDSSFCTHNEERGSLLYGKSGITLGWLTGNIPYQIWNPVTSQVIPTGKATLHGLQLAASRWHGLESW